MILFATGHISAQDTDNMTSTTENTVIDEDIACLHASDAEVVASDNNAQYENSSLKAKSQDVIYFDANRESDGDGSQSNPYKYLTSERITPGVTAYFNDGTYELNSTCIISGAKLVGSAYTRIFSSMNDDYDFIVAHNSVLELTRMNIYNFNILNQGTLTAENVIFHGNDLFDTYFGGVIVCDNPNAITNLTLNACSFEDIYDAYNGGCIAAINSNLEITHCRFSHFSSLYRGGAIYSLNSNLTISDSRFEPYTNSIEELIRTRENQYTAYYGGSIYCENSNIVLKRNSFIGSISFSFGGCIAALNSVVNSRDDYFNESKSLTDGGGALYISNGELYIVNSRLYNNSAEFGGAICNINSILDSYRTWYVFNSANRYGGVIYDIYGTLNLNTNLFGDSRASVGGIIYTRIPNVFNVYSNSFATAFAEKGSTIFFDGKKENMDTTFFTSQFSVDYDNLMIPISSTGLETYNTFRNTYSVFAEFTATVNGEEYSIISNPIYYQISNRDDTYFENTWHTYRVSDGKVSMMIHDLNDELSQTDVYCRNELRNVTAEINLTGEFTNPTLKFYLIKGANIFLYNNYGPDSSNLYTDTRDKLFKGSEYELLETYSIDLSDKVQGNTAEATCSLNFANPFLNFNFGNIYEAGSFYPASLLNSSFVNSLSQMQNQDPLSQYYNSNDYGLVSIAKDQKNGGNCWAFAGLATLETCLKKATGITFDLSEENAKNLMAAYSVFGVKIDTNYGGYDYMMMGYLTSWLGPIDESIEDYDEYSSISIQENPMFHIQNIKFLPARLNSADNDLYKLAIRDYGAVSVMLKWNNGDYHAVSLVGWDDNYVGTDSLGNTAHGAWIFKNSWGPDWENNGFGYLSYEEKISEQLRPEMHAYTFIFDDINPYTKIYQYDFAGVSEFYHYQNSIYFKNDFIAENASLLSAFSTYFDSETSFTVSVYKNGAFMFSQDGTSQAGYYTIPFDTIIQLDKGDKFSIVVNNHNNGANCIPVCSADEITKKTFNSNVSFISLDGETWFDLYDYADSCHVACIKAFTQNTTRKGITINMEKFTQVDNNHLSVKVNVEDFDEIKSIDFCLLKFVVDGNPYYAQIKNGKATLNLDLDNGVHSISVQYKDNIFESNIIQFTFTVAKNDASTSYNGLQSLINNAQANSRIDFYKDYSYDAKFDDGEYGIRIDKAISINGHGHIIDGLSEATALYISANNVELNNIVFKNTVSINGGAIYITGRNITLNNCSFINSKAENGGGIYSLFDISLNNCKFINNIANVGGGLYILSTATTNIKNSLFDNNVAGTDASAIYITGIGSISLSSSNFTDNAAANYGGAIMSNLRHANITNCIFSNNSATIGGGIYSTDNLNEIKDSRFINNTAEKYGGAILASNSINIHDSEFIGNKVPYNETETTIESLAEFGGGAIYSLKNMNIYNSNFTKNNASNGGAILSRESSNIYQSRFDRNTAKRGGAILNTETRVLKYTDGRITFGSEFTQTNIYDSIFTKNTAKFGSALYEVNLVKNSIFKDNHALTIGTVYDINIVDNSSFTNNSAESGGAIYSVTLVKNSVFSDNHASENGGAIYGALKIFDCIFTGNSARFGGAIISLSETNIISCTFSKNNANVSGGAVYMNGKAIIKASTFNQNIATYGGSAYFSEGGRYTVETSDFTKNMASDFGGAIFTYSSGKASMAYLDISLCNFTGNNVNKSGGAIYTESKTTVSNSNFADNTAKWGSAIYARAYLDLKNSNIRSDSEVIPVSYAAHYNEDNSFYGDLYLKNNVIDADIGIFYADDELKSSSQYYLVFHSAKITKGENISMAHLEDDNGNLIRVYGMGDLYLTLTNQNNIPVRVTLKYNMDLCNYYLDTSMIDYGTYKVSGLLSKNHPGSYSVKQSTLFITDEAGHLPVALSGSLTKVYGTSNSLTITLRDGYGNVLPNTLISINLNGKTSQIKTNAKGQASLGVNLAPKTYTATVTFNGNEQHLKSSIKTTVTVKKANPKIIASKKTYKLKAKTKKYTVTLKDNLGRTIKKAKVTIKVNGKTYTAKTNSKGKATFKLKLKKKGNLKAKITYAGNAYYNKVTKTVKIKIKK